MGERRHRTTAAVVAATATVGIAACGATVDSVTSESIVDLGNAHGAELANSSFEEPTVAPWQIAGEQYATFAATREFSWEGQRSARIRARGRRVRGSVVLAQIVRPLPPAEPGSRYRLVIRTRTRGLNRRVQVQLKLIYDNAKFDFFPARAVAAGSGTGIPPGTWRDWITLKVDAVAKRRVQAIQVFGFDSGSGPLRGTVWVDSAELSSRGPKAG